MSISFLKSHRIKKGHLLYFLFMLYGINFSQNVLAHQTPTTIVLLDVSPGKVAMELQLPLSELDLAFGHDIAKNPLTAIQTLGPELKEYLKTHIHAFIAKENPWEIAINNMQIEKGEQVASGPPSWELIAHITLKPPTGISTRKFTLDYDVIMHQVINHAAFVSVRNDWELGKTTGQPVEVGVINWNTKDNLIYPLQINLEKGNWWNGFASMLSLGKQHIAEGTDHLLFLLVLLLPATLLVKGKRWGSFGGTKYSIVRLLKIVTAFTIGHSITLLVGALGWLHLPAQPVEVLIAVSILVSAIHAVRPLFPGNEMYVAAGFGLIHGLAFASVLANLNLGAGPMALSILGFNLGIELMQLFVIAITVPWLILFSRTSFYKYVRTGGAIFAGIASLAWISERISGKANVVTELIQKATGYELWLIAALALSSVAAWFWKMSRTKNIVAL